MKISWKRWFLFPAVLPLFSWTNTGNVQKDVVSQPLDTIEYRIFVAVDKAGVEHWGGKEAYRAKLNTFFEQVNDFWNKAGDGRFNFYFRYVPDLQVVYDCSSRQLENVYNRSAGFPNHDVLLIIDSVLDFDDEEKSQGWYCGGAADDLTMVVCRSRSKTEHEDLFNVDYFCRGVAHEFGHYRGVTDLYADRIQAKKNVINQLQYEPDSCVMNNHYNTYKWSSYAVNIINYTAKSKRPRRDFSGLFKQMFPKNILVSVKVNGKKKKGVKLNLYGARAQFNDLIPTPYRTYEVNKKGEYLITGVPDLYDNPAEPLHTDELPYNRWFSFLLEAEYKGEKKYVWLPEYEVQQTFFENKDTYQVTIDF
ncbi:hypothetical protein SAMN05444349_102125 [Bacteroides faecichinchillae]|uniref:Uncharacterized protein n=1 Tax=Bacteroides faecichinchillae TaxID=871325 RepID=A0A1M4TI81_9BACE|nr:hypothetical protein [Bacteroides faecichinchillae]THG67972.1 hypothetical protein E5981_06830 [Bacteroides faecichinchillae]SHE43987.1 hypothetical protein SAMN05444349_102125 [Bacteroides faecichinchillae]